MRLHTRAILLLTLAVCVCSVIAACAQEPAARSQTARAVAVTFDDLPATRFRTLVEGQAITSALLRHIRAHHIPAVGFVNEVKLERADEKEALTALLQEWLDAGLELGNHTYSHKRLFDTPLAEFQDEVLRGERVTRRLMSARGMQLRYFRHPTLNTGPDLATKAAFEQFLREHGYQVAPVTIDNDEYIYALAYERAQGDSALASRVAQDYVRYMEEVFAFYEQLSRDVLAREPAQVLLLHANLLNAHNLPALVEMMRRRGYGFVSLEQALQDPAYDLPDRYIGPRGPSWLQRWAVTMGKKAGDQPAVPEWVRVVSARR